MGSRVPWILSKEVQNFCQTGKADSGEGAFFFLKSKYIRLKYKKKHYFFLPCRSRRSCPGQGAERGKNCFTYFTGRSWWSCLITYCIYWIYILFDVAKSSWHDSCNKESTFLPFASSLRGGNGRFRCHPACFLASGEVFAMPYKQKPPSFTPFFAPSPLVGTAPPSAQNSTHGLRPSS